MISRYAARIRQAPSPISYCSRRWCFTTSPSNKKILITSALPYVNNVPHLGNVIGCVLSADVFARYKRSAGEEVLFVCGTDEYGTATEVKAKQENTTPQSICDKYHQIHDQAYKWFDISFDIFGRTSTPTHNNIVQDLFGRLERNGYVTEDTHQQHYCSSCFMFLADRYVKGICPKCSSPGAKGDQCDSCNQLIVATELRDPVCTQCNKTPQIRQTKHLYIDLHKLQGKVESWMSVSAKQWSSNSRAIAESWLKQGLRPRSITRDLKWGVPVPKEGFTDKVFYVWFDAPIGYISITAHKLGEKYKQWWESPQNTTLYQFMGKDNVPFHALMFPATLLGTSQNTPYSSWTMVNQICATEYLNYENTKFSKSNNVGVFCDSLSNDTTIECFVWRYYLLSIRPERADANFQWSEFAMKVNNELIGNLGNLFSRVLNLIHKTKQRNVRSLSVPELTADQKNLINSCRMLLVEYQKYMDKIELREGFKKAFEISSAFNKYLQDTKPWEKSAQESGATDRVLSLSACGLRLLRTVMEPFMPGFVRKTQSVFGKILPISVYLQVAKEDKSFQQFFVSGASLKDIAVKPSPLVRSSKKISPSVASFAYIFKEEEWKKYKERFG